MDFIERLKDKLNTLPLPVRLNIGYLGTSEALVIYPLPGSRTIAEYMDGTKDVALNFEIAMKSKRQDVIHNTLWLLHNSLENIETLESGDDSFQFDEIVITNKPFINQLDDQGWFIFLLDIQAKITTKK